MPLPAWTTCECINADDGRFDKVILLQKGFAELEEGMTQLDLPDRLIGGQYLSGGASSSNAQWNRHSITRPLLLSASNGWPANFASSELTFDRPYAIAPNTVSFRCYTHFNPSRMRGYTRRRHLGEWFSSAVEAPVIVRERTRETHEACILPPGSFDAAEATQAVSGAISDTIFPDGQDFSERSITYAECYWEFQHPNPVLALEELAPVLRSQGGDRDIVRQDVTGETENGIRVLHDRRA